MMRKRLEDSARRAAVRLEASRIPTEMVLRRRESPTSASAKWLGRLQRFRTTVVPWMASSAPLEASRILEVGAGEGSSTAALVEQGANVTAIDIASMDEAANLLAEMGLSAEFEQCNAAELARIAERRGYERIVFWASLHHMTIEERIPAIREAWACLAPGGLLTVVETPNRLWPFDSHTSLLPFFSWLPYELGYRYSTRSPRPGFGDRYTHRTKYELEDFRRRGHGVSFHEFDLALGDHQTLEVESCMQHYWRKRNRARGLGWVMSQAGRTERVLAGYSPKSHRAWFQPFLYLSLRKTAAQVAR